MSMRFKICCAVIAIGCLLNWRCGAVEVRCIDELTNRISIFNATESHAEPFIDVTFDIPDSECFIDESIIADENDTLTIMCAIDAEQITSITFAKPSAMQTFPAIIFETFPHLNVAHLISSGLEVIAQDDFLHATELRRLRLELNNITQITSRSFAHPIELQALELPANQINEIDNYSFATLKKLTKLDLQQNNLTTIREHTLSGAVNLVDLYLNDNQIEFIDDGAFYLPKLMRIFLQDNRLKTLSINLLTGTPALYGIDLSRNQLETIQNIFDKCGNLTIIGLNYNRIKTIDLIELADMPSLRVLSLEGNKLQFDGGAAAADANHTTMTANDAYAHLIPSKTYLEYLNLDSNNLSSAAILIELNVFRRLKFLDLDDNKFTKIDDFTEIRRHFPHFIQINMNENPLNCAWLEDVWPFIEQSGIVFQTHEIDSDEDDDRPLNSKFLAGSNQKQVNNITCNIEDDYTFVQNTDIDTAIPFPIDETIV